MESQYPQLPTSEINEYIESLRKFLDSLPNWAFDKEMTIFWLDTVKRAYHIGYNQCVKDMFIEATLNDFDEDNIDKWSIA